MAMKTKRTPIETAIAYMVIAETMVTDAAHNQFLAWNEYIAYEMPTVCGKEYVTASMERAELFRKFMKAAESLHAAVKTHEEHKALVKNLEEMT